MVYDMTNPASAQFQACISNRDFQLDPTSPAEGEVGPEGSTCISAENSPNGMPMLAVGNEVSGTTTLYEIDSTITEAEDGSSDGSTGSADEPSLSSTSGVLAAITAMFGLLGVAIEHVPDLQHNVRATVDCMMGR